MLVSQGQSLADAIRQIGVSEVTYYRLRQEFGGLKTEQIKRLKDLELENGRLRRVVSDLTGPPGAGPKEHPAHARAPETGLPLRDDPADCRRDRTPYQRWIKPSQRPTPCGTRG